MVATANRADLIILIDIDDKSSLNLRNFFANSKYPVLEIRDFGAEIESPNSIINQGYASATVASSRELNKLYIFSKGTLRDLEYINFQATKGPRMGNYPVKQTFYYCPLK